MARRILIFVATTAMVLGMSAFTASAGEITKNKDRPMVVETITDENGHDHQILHGKSACAFSGLNDEYLNEYDNFEGPAGDQVASDFFGRTQNWGQIPKAFRPPFTPGDACNPTKFVGEPDL